MICIKEEGNDVAYSDASYYQCNALIKPINRKASNEIHLVARIVACMTIGTLIVLCMPWYRRGLWSVGDGQYVCRLCCEYIAVPEKRATADPEPLRTTGKWK